MADCPVCHAPAPDGRTSCVRHGPPPAASQVPLPIFPVAPGTDARKTVMLRLEDLTVAPDARATAVLRLPVPAASPSSPDADGTAHPSLPEPPEDPASQATAIFRLPSLPEAPTDPAVPSLSRVAAAPDPDAQATTTFKLPSLEVATDPNVAPVAASSPDAQATATFKVAVHEERTDLALPPVRLANANAQATAVFEPPALATGAAKAPAAPSEGPDAQPTATFRRPLPDDAATTQPSMARVAAPAQADAPKTSVRPARSEDLIATARARVAPPPTAVKAPLPPPKVSLPSPAPPRRQGTAIGRTFGHRFEVRAHLGSGGFGATYVAWDGRLKRECVIKILRAVSSDPSPFEVELLKRFSNEALTLAHLLHPNITQVFDHGEEPDGAHWIAMEYVRGRSLADIGREEKQLDGLRVARLGAQIAGALALAHSRGIVHRDLKPDNVLVLDGHTGGEQAKVLDFGIARITDPAALGLDRAQANLTQLGAFLGTPAFMSPEQAQGAAVGPASDVYSLGVVLYLLLTGRLPGSVPTAWNPMTTLAYVVSPFDPVRRLRPDCPPLLAETVEAMLVKEQPKRTLSAAQVQTELQTTDRQGGARTLPTGRRSLAPLVAAGAVVVALGAVVALQLTRRPVKQVEQIQALPAAPPVAVAPDPRPRREARIAEVLQRARAGESAAAVDPAADGLANVAPDARLFFAKGLAHVTDNDLDGAVVLLQAAVDLGADAPVAREAEDQKNAALAALRARARARPAVAAPDEPARQKERPVLDRPEH